MTPKSIQHYILGPRRQHRFERAALIKLVRTIDCVATYAPVIVFAVWGCLALREKRLNVSRSLLWPATAFLILSAIYVIARGSKKANWNTYLDYYPKLAGAPDAERWKTQGILNPQTKVQCEHFIDWHTGHIAFLASQNRWHAVVNLLQSTQRYYPHMLRFLVTYAIQLRNDRLGLNKNKTYVAISKALMSQWLNSTTCLEGSDRCDVLLRLVSGVEEVSHSAFLALLPVEDRENVVLSLLVACEAPLLCEALEDRAAALVKRLNALLEGCVSDLDEKAAQFLGLFIRHVFDKNVWHYLGPFYTLVGAPLSVSALQNFKTSFFSFCDTAIFRHRVVAILIYSLHPEEEASNVMTLFQDRHYFVEEVRQILSVFEFSSSLGETEALCQQLRSFGIQEFTLQRLIALTDDCAYRVRFMEPLAT